MFNTRRTDNLCLINLHGKNACLPYKVDDSVLLVLNEEFFLSSLDDFNLLFWHELKSHLFQVLVFFQSCYSDRIGKGKIEVEINSLRGTAHKVSCVLFQNKFHYYFDKKFILCPSQTYQGQCKNLLF